MNSEELDKPEAAHAPFLATALVTIFLSITSGVPYMYGPVSFACLAVAAALLISRPLPRTTMGQLWPFILAALGLFATLHGSLNATPGAFAMITVWVIEPILVGVALTLWAVAAPRKHIYFALDTALLVTCALGMLVYVEMFLPVSAPPWLIDPEFRVIDLSGALPRTNFQGYNNLVFLAPYGLYRAWEIFRSKGSMLLGLVLTAASLSSILLSGRRILIISVPLAVVAMLWVGYPRLRALIVTGGAAFTGVALSWNLLQHVEGLFSQNLQSLGADTRGDQHRLLLDAAWEHPIWGAGAGKILPNYSRSDDTPWSYELTYHVLFLNVGFFGLAVLSAWMLWTISRLLRPVAEREPLVTAIFCGLVSTLAASATNPYLFKLDGIWMVLLPFAIAAAVDAQRKPSATQLPARAHALRPTPPV